MKHTKEDYIKALKVVREYEEQVKADKLSPYINCTVDNIVLNLFTCNLTNKKCIAYWVSNDCEIPNRDPDAVIRIDSTSFYTIDGGKIVYTNLGDAYKAVIKKFKRMKLIK